MDDIQQLKSTPRFLICSICGRNFGTKSLMIHRKQCAEKNKIADQALSIPQTNSDIERFNQQALEEFSRNAVSNGVKYECGNCKRSFARKEGLEKHHILCSQSEGGGTYFGKRYQKEPPPILSKNAGAIMKKDPRGLPTVKYDAPPVAITKTLESYQSGLSTVNYEAPSVAVTKTFANVDHEADATKSKDPFNSSANFCTQCGLNFAMDNSWKFCPQCGTKRLSSIQR